MASNLELIDKVKSEFGGSVLETTNQFDQAAVSVKREDVAEVLQFLRDDPETDFDFLIDVCGVDYLEMGGIERYAIVYQLYSLKHSHRLRIKAYVPENDLKIDTVSHLWPAAEWAEREVYDMYGIEFNNHPDMRRILNPDDFEGFALRKDFPVDGIGYREDYEKIERATGQEEAGN
ncbi:MAG: NADH-quinone oxidoreductase subunit C [bacterium]